MITNKPTICRYCGHPVAFTTNSEIYGKEYGNGKCFLCRNCRAFVGVHTDTNIPLGTLANDELRAWRKEAHYWFDKLWKGTTKITNRYKAYGWLANEMKLDRVHTHIGMFEIKQCQEVIRLSKERLNNRKEQKICS